MCVWGGGCSGHNQPPFPLLCLPSTNDVSCALQSGRGLSRLSSSCPSLNVDGEEGDDDDSPTCKSPAGPSPALAGTSSSSSSVVVCPHGHGHAHGHACQGRRGSGRLSSRSDDGETTSPNTPNTPITSSSLDEHHLCPDTPKIRVNDSTPTGTRPSGPSPVRSSARLRLCPPRHAHPPTRCTNCMHTAATASDLLPRIP